MSLQIASLREEHLGDAAALVSVRYKALRERVPVLPSRYEEVDTIVAMLRGLTGETEGVIATRGSRLVGFLLGFEPVCYSLMRCIDERVGKENRKDKDAQPGSLTVFSPAHRVS